VVDAYPMASLVMLITDPTFAAGVISQKGRVRGTLKGLGQTKCLVDYAQNEEKVDEGEWFYTSGDDRIFPRGFPVGQVSSVHNGKTFKEIYLIPSGMQGGVEEVLIMLQGQHLQIPDSATATPGYKILPAPNDAVGETAQPTGQPTVLTTDADRLREQYKQSGESQHHVFGEGLPGSTPPDFTKIPGIRSSTPTRAPETPTPSAIATQPNRDRKEAQPKPPSTSPATAVETPAKAAAAVPPKPKPHPTTPILVTDPTDADPDAVPPPAPKTDKPVKPPGGNPSTHPPSGNP
jgi:rod shape-determining protein MreC